MSTKDQKGLKVKDHPDQDLLAKMLLSGWSPKKIELWLKARYPDDDTKWISEHTLLDYRKNFIALRQGLPASYYAQRLKELDITIDTLQELYNQIEQQKRRIDFNLKVEDASNIALPDTRKEMELLHTMIVNAIELEMKLGIKKSVPDQLEIKSLNLEILLDRYILNKNKTVDVTPATQ